MLELLALNTLGVKEGIEINCGGYRYTNTVHTYYLWIGEAANKQNGRIDLPRVARFSQQNPPNCNSKLVQWRFDGGLPVKIAFRRVKYTFFGKVPLAKFILQGINITYLGSLQPADIKNNRVKVAQFWQHWSRLLNEKAKRWLEVI